MYMFQEVNLKKTYNGKRFSKQSSASTTVSLSRGVGNSYGPTTMHMIKFRKS